MTDKEIVDTICACDDLIRRLRADGNLHSRDLAVVARALNAPQSAAYFSRQRKSGFYLDASRSREDTMRQLADLREDLELELAAQRRHGVKPQPRRTATSEQGKERR